MVLAVWGGIADAPILISLRFLIALLAMSVLASILRMFRRGNLVVLRGSPILALWLATRFILAPAFILIGLAWAVSWLFGLAMADPLQGALLLLLVYGGSAIFVTSALADVAAAIRGPARNARIEPPDEPSPRP